MEVLTLLEKAFASSGWLRWLYAVGLMAMLIYTLSGRLFLHRRWRADINTTVKSHGRRLNRHARSLRQMRTQHQVWETQLGELKADMAEIKGQLRQVLDHLLSVVRPGPGRKEGE